ncbi:MAG: hypothetical protein EOP45_17690 [Sphingobacteriaceae bacterium]|nr:MAG: hypothetical protein EOP45_17690 [Sphingobacteriaceae bacterium]
MIIAYIAVFIYEKLIPVVRLMLCTINNDPASEKRHTRGWFSENITPDYADRSNGFVDAVDRKNKKNEHDKVLKKQTRYNK